jgi:hypothetical protein
VTSRLKTDQKNKLTIIKADPQCQKTLSIITNFLLSVFFHSTAAEVVISLIKMYEANYPEILKHCFIINGKVNYFEIYILVQYMSKLQF